MESHISRKGSKGDNKKSLSGWQEADPVAYKLKLTVPFHALCCRKIQDTVDIIRSALEPAEVRSKIRAFDVLTSGCLQEKICSSSEPDGACCMLGAARQCYGSPPVVLITVHDKGIRWSGRREESRGDPCCSV